MRRVSKVKRRLREFVLGSRPGFFEPAKISKKIQNSVYPKDWDPNDTSKYNNWTKEYNLSVIYHIKQTNNVAWK